MSEDVGAPPQSGVLWQGVVGGGIAAAMVAAYLAIIATDDNTDLGSARVVFLTAMLAAAAAAAVVGSLVDRRSLRPALLAGATAALAALGFLAIFSVGLPLLAAAVLVLWATVQAIEAAPGRGRRLALLTVAAVLGLLLAGLPLTA